MRVKSAFLHNSGHKMRRIQVLRNTSELVYVILPMHRISVSSDVVTVSSFSSGFASGVCAIEELLSPKFEPRVQPKPWSFQVAES